MTGYRIGWVENGKPSLVHIARDGVSTRTDCGKDPTPDGLTIVRVPTRTMGRMRHCYLCKTSYKASWPWHPTCQVPFLKRGERCS